MKHPIPEFSNRPVRRRTLLTVAVAAGVALSLPAFSAETFTINDFQELCAAFANGRVVTSAEATEYLAAIRCFDPAQDLVALLRLVRSTPEGVLDAAIRSQGFDAIVNTIVGFIYSGMTGSGNDIKVATYTNAMAWNALPYAKPNGQCGGEFGYWGTRPAS